MRLESRLRSLAAVRAPAGLYGKVLAEVGEADRYAEVDTALGAVYVAWSGAGVSAVYQARSPEVFERWFAATIGRPLRPSPEPVPAGLLKNRRFDLRTLGRFQQAVLLKALEIPAGEVRSYAWIAREIGHPAAVRAVGTALARNPIPVFIPCHRVVRSDGLIGNYGLGGRENKIRILRAEGVDPDELERLARAGIRYTGSRTTHIFCLHTCRHARRVQDRHRVRFHDEREARGAGYRPCKVCKPAPAAV